MLQHGQRCAPDPHAESTAGHDRPDIAGNNVHLTRCRKVRKACTVGADVHKISNAKGQIVKRQ